MTNSTDAHFRALDRVRDQVAAGQESLRGIEVRVEVWAFMADPTGIFLVSETPGGLGGPWLSPKLGPWGGEAKWHAAAEGLCERHGQPVDTCQLLHSTGWRPKGEGLVLPYIAAVGHAGGYGESAGRLTFAYDAFPWGPGVGTRKVWEMGARPVGEPLYDDQGGPRPHGATERPCPRDLDQLWNCLEHARWLRDSNGPIRRQLDRHWHQGLEDWRGVLGGASLYDPLAS